MDNFWCCMTEIRFVWLLLQFIYSEATKFCEISPILLTTVYTLKSKVEILQNFVAFSEYMNFTLLKLFFTKIWIATPPIYLHFICTIHFIELKISN